MRLFNYGLSHLSIHCVLEKCLSTSSLDKMNCITEDIHVQKTLRLQTEALYCHGNETAFFFHQYE